VFQMHLAICDRAALEALRDTLGFGCINDRPGKGNWEPSATLSISSRKAHLASTIPFMEEYLLPSQKRTQFEQWRDALVAYEAANPRKVGRSICSEPGCDDPVRGRGLCRRHYYRATGW